MESLPTHKQLLTLLDRVEQLENQISWPPSILTAIFPHRRIIPKAHLLGDHPVHREVAGDLDLKTSGDRAVACRRLKDRLGHPWYELVEMSEAGLVEVLTEDLRRQIRDREQKQSEQAAQEKERVHQSFRAALQDARASRVTRPFDRGRCETIAQKMRQFDQTIGQTASSYRHHESQLIVQAVTYLLEAVAAGWRNEDVEVILNSVRSYDETFCMMPQQLESNVAQESLPRSFCSLVATAIETDVAGEESARSRMTE